MGGFLKKHPQAVLTCARGGLRSQISQQWIESAGVQVPRIAGGYKALRQFLLQTLEVLGSQLSMVVLSGPTGSGKTHFLRFQKALPYLDLEKSAHHRGSAFGGFASPQPTQATFENHLATQIVCLQPKTSVLIEDESRMIGSCVVPESIFLNLRASALVVLDVPLRDRVLQTYQEYIVETALGTPDIPRGLQVIQFFRVAILKIRKKLGDFCLMRL